MLLEGGAGYSRHRSRHMGRPRVRSDRDITTGTPGWAPQGEGGAVYCVQGGGECRGGGGRSVASPRVVAHSYTWSVGRAGWDAQRRGDWRERGAGVTTGGGAGSPFLPRAGVSGRGGETRWGGGGGRVRSAQGRKHNGRSDGVRTAGGGRGGKKTTGDVGGPVGLESGGVWGGGV